MHDDSQWSTKNWFGHRTRRGDLTPLILRSLSNKPMHGYEIISHLEEKSHGMWLRSAGSVYPTLQLLEEQELVTSKSAAGKKVYTLTEKGVTKASIINEHIESHWKERELHAKSYKELKLTFIETMNILKNITSQNSEEKNKEVKKILKETKKKLAEVAEK